MDEETIPDTRSFITCVAWVPRGKAKENPEKVGVTPEDLARIIEETKGKIEDLDDDESEDEGKEEKENDDMNDNEMTEGQEGEDTETKMEEAEAGAMAEKTEKTKDRKKEKKKNKEKEEGDEEEDFEKLYNFEEYDNEIDNTARMTTLGNLTMYANNDEDPLITVKDRDDKDSESGDDVILPSDNLIAVGHVEGDAAILEIHVYNAEEVSFYVHHDILLPAVPLCMEWMNYDPGDECLRPGNMLAIGSMSPVIEVWDLDIADSLEPAFTLGKKGKKKKKMPGVGHRDAVLSLAWNTHAEHVLASGSVDETVILWDMEHATVAQQMKAFNEKVQSIKWHPKEAHTLLAGSCDKKVRMFDCNTDNTFKMWNLDAEVECVLWDKFSDKPYNFLASTESGCLYYFDGRQEKPLWTVKAHEKACTGISTSPECPGCLVTVSIDEAIKIWDIAEGKPTCVEEKSPNLGIIHCLSECPDLPFVFCMGGDNKENNFKVWDIRESINVRRKFCPRVGLPVDEEMETEAATKAMDRVRLEDDETIHVITPRPAVPNNKPKSKKFQKKKGGHLGKKKKH